MRIGGLAAQTGVTAKTIRFWEATGRLADPTRTPSGYRDYDEEAVDRLSFICHAKTAGLTLAEFDSSHDLRLRRTTVRTRHRTHRPAPR